MDKSWRSKICGVDFYTAMILASGLIGDLRDAWLPSVIYWDSSYYGRAGLDISIAFEQCYLRQNWES